MEPFEHVPDWVLQPLADNAPIDPLLHARLDELSQTLPDSLGDIWQALDAAKTSAAFDAAVNRASAHVWLALGRFYAASAAALRVQLLAFASEHMTRDALAHILRRLVKDPSLRVRAQARTVLNRLCCYTPDPRGWGNAVLPQGAPTSPAISNLVCRRLDARLAGLARRCEGVYTRYADDLTFSFKNTSVDLGRFRWWVDQVCHQEGFFVNQRKFRVIRCSQRQLVTGIVVNDELRVPREERRRFRAILHNCQKHGIASQAGGQPDFAEYLRGFASYVHMVHPEEGVELLRQVEAL